MTEPASIAALVERLPEMRAAFERRFMTSAIDEYCPEEFGELLDAITSLQSRIEQLERERERMRGALSNSRQVAKRRGRDLRREEADAILPFFQRQWEPLRLIAQRAGQKSACELASCARDLVSRGLIESRWIGHMSIKEYRAALTSEKGNG